MSLSLGELILQLGLDSTRYRSQLNQAKLDALKTGAEIERILGGQSVNSKPIDSFAAKANTSEQKWAEARNRLKQPLVTSVDDRQLTALNKHIDLKIDHWDEAVRVFGRKPIRPSFDGSGFAAAAVETDAALDQHSRAQAEFNNTEMRPVIAPLHTDRLNKDLTTQQDRLSESVAYFDENPVVIRVDTSQLDAATERLREFQSNYEQMVSRVASSPVEPRNVGYNGVSRDSVRYDENLKRYRYADGPDKGKFAPHPDGVPYANFSRKPQTESIGDKARGVVIDHVLEKTLGSAVDLALEEGFTQVLNLTSRILKEQFGGVSSFGIGKVLSQEVDKLKDKTQRQYAPEKGVTGRVEAAKRKIDRDVILAPAKFLTAPIREVMSGFYGAIGGVYGSRFGEGTADRAEKKMGRSISDIGSESGVIGDMVSGAGAVDAVVNRMGKLAELEDAAKPVLKKYGIDLDAAGVEETLTDGALVYAKRVAKILENSLDENKIQDDIASAKQAFVELGKAIAVTDDKASQAQALKDLVASIDNVVAYPKQAVVAKYKQNAKESAENLSDRVESPVTPAEKLDEHIRRVAFVSAGFSATEGKQSHNVAAQVAKYAGDDVKIVPFENREFEVTKDSATDGTPAWLLDVLNTVSSTVEKGFNPAAVRMAAEAAQYKEQNPNVDIDLVGHSAGGLIAREAQEILKHLGIDARVFAMATPNIGAFESSTDRAVGIMGGSDPMRHISDDDLLDNRVAGHEFRNYNESPDTQKRLGEFLNAPTRSNRPGAAVNADEDDGPDPIPPTGSRARPSPLRPKTELLDHAVDQIFTALNQPAPSDTKKKVREGYKLAADEILALVDEGRSEFAAIDAKAGFRASEASKGQKYSLDDSDLPRVETSLSHKQAEQITLFVGGFGGVNGLESEYLGQELSRNLPNHHVAAVESPEFDVKPEAGQTVVHPDFLKKAYQTIVGQASKDGDNISARRMAERAYVYRKENPDTPINLVGQSGGTMVARAAAQILHEMQVDNVRVVGTAGPHFGASDQDGMTLASNKDPFRTIAGPLMTNMVAVDSVTGHSKYYNTDGPGDSRKRTMQIESGEAEIRVNAQVAAALNAFFDRSVDEPTALENAREASAKSYSSAARSAETSEQLDVFEERKHPAIKKGEQLAAVLEEMIKPQQLLSGVDTVGLSLRELIGSIARLDAAAQSVSLEKFTDSIQSFGKPKAPVIEPPVFTADSRGQMQLLPMTKQYPANQLELLDHSMKPLLGLTPEVKAQQNSQQISLFDENLAPIKFKDGQNELVNFAKKAVDVSADQLSEISLNLAESFSPVTSLIAVGTDRLAQARDVLRPVANTARNSVQTNLVEPVGQSLQSASESARESLPVIAKAVKDRAIADTQIVVRKIKQAFQSKSAILVDSEVAIEATKPTDLVDSQANNRTERVKPYIAPEIEDPWGIDASVLEVSKNMTSLQDLVSDRSDLLNEALSNSVDQIESVVSTDSTLTKKRTGKISKAVKQVESIAEPESSGLNTEQLKSELQSKSVTRSDLLKIAKAAGIGGVSKSNKSVLAEKIVEANPLLAAQMLQEKEIIAKLLQSEKSFGALIDAAKKLNGNEKTAELEKLRNESIDLIYEMDSGKYRIETGVNRSEYGGIKGRLERRLKTRLAITPEMIENRRSKPVESERSTIDDISGLARINPNQKKNFFQKVQGFFQRAVDNAAQSAIDAVDTVNGPVADQMFGLYAGVKSGEALEALENLSSDAYELAMQEALHQINNVDANIADSLRAVYASSKDGDVGAELPLQVEKQFDRAASVPKEFAKKHFSRDVSPNMEGSATHEVGGFRFTVSDEINQKVVQGRKRVEQAVQVHGIWKRTFTKNLEKNYTEFARQVAKSSNIEMKPGDMPILEVNDRLLKKMGVEAFYDIKKNRVIVSKEIAKALDRDASELKKYEETLQAVTHELRHAAQFSFGKKKMSDISSGQTGFGVSIVSESEAPSEAVQNADASVEAIQKQSYKKNKYTFSDKESQTLKAAEVDAYSFEAKTGDIIENVSGDLKARSRKDFEMVADYAKQGADMMVSHFAKRFPMVAGIVDDMVGKMKVIPIQLLQGFASFKVLEWVLQKIPQIAGASVEAAQRFERLGLKMNFVAGSASVAQRNFALIRAEAKRLGTDLEQSASGFVSIASAAKGGALEGSASESIFKSLNQASSVYQLDPETQGRMFKATEQMISKGSAVSSEELKQQLGEALPGTIQIAARAAGKSTGEFTKMLEAGQVLVDDFLPKFANQLSAETSTGVTAASDTAQASLNRFNATINDVKVSLGTPLLEVQKNAFKVFNGVLSALMPVLSAFIVIAGAGLASTAYSGAAALLKFATGMSLSTVLGQVLTAGLKMLGTVLGQLAMQFVRAVPLMLAFQAATDVVGAVGKVFKNAGQDAKDAADQISAFNDKYNEMKGITKQPENSFEAIVENVKSGRGLTGLGINSKQDSALSETIIGKTIDFALGKGATTTAEQAVQQSVKIAAKYSGTQFVADRIFGEGNIKFGSTFAEKKHNDLISETNNFEFAAGETRGKAYEMFDPVSKKARGSLKQTVEIDAKLQSLSAERRTIRPGEEDKKRDLDRQIEELRGQRESASKEIAAVQGQLAAQVQARTGLIKGMKDYRDSGQVTGKELEQVNNQIKSMEANLEADQSALNKFNKILGHSADEARRLKESIEDIDFDSQGGQKELNQKQAQDKAQLSKQLVGATSGSKEESLRRLELKQLSERSALNDQLSARYREMLESTEAQRTLSVAGFGSTPVDDLQGSELKKLASRMTDGQEKTSLEQLSDAVDKMQDLKTETIGMGQQISDSQSQALEKLKESTKSVEEFYRQIQRSAEESALAAKETRNQISTINAKTKIKKALTGFQDNYVSEWADGLVNLVEQFNEPFKIALEAQKQTLAKKNSLEDLLRQQTEQARQLPTGYEGMSTGGVGTPVGAPIGSPVGKGVDTSGMNLWSTGGGVSDNISGSGQLRQHHNMRGAYTDRADGRYNGDKIVHDMTFEDKASKSVDVPIPAAVTGTVIKAGLKGGYGNTVIIKDALTGEEVLMGHLKSISVKAGQKIAEGMEIGIQGGTGKGGRKTMDTHLHLEASKATTKRYVDNVLQGKYKGVVGTAQQHFEGDGHNHAPVPAQSAYQGGQKHVVIPLDHSRTRIPDKTGGNTYVGAGQTGAAYKGYTERDFQDALASKAKAKLESQGYKVTVLAPENFKSFEDYDNVIAKLSKQKETIVTPLHYDARMSGYSGGYLTRSRAGDSADNRLSNAIFQNMKASAGGSASSKFVGQDTEANATIKAASAAPATLVEFGAMADLLDRYGSVPKYLKSTEFSKGLGGYVAGVNQFTGGGRPSAPVVDRSPINYVADRPSVAMRSAGGGLDRAGLAAMMSGGTDSTIAKIIGMAEGNRTASGAKTDAFYGHIDPGNKARNIGSFSAQGGLNTGNAETSDQRVIERLLKPRVEELFAQAQKKGVSLTPKLVMNYLDSYNQSPMAAKEARGGTTFFSGLGDLKGRENDDSAILALRTKSYHSGGQYSIAGGTVEHDQGRRMDELNKALMAFRGQISSTGSVPIATMMPTTGMTQGQVESNEAHAKQYSDLQGQLSAAGKLASQTTAQEIDGIKRLAAAQGMLAEVENKMAMRRSEFQLKQGGRDQEKATRGISEQMQDMKMQLGEDTPYKQLRANLMQAEREYKQFGESVFENSQKINHALSEAMNMKDLIQSGQLPEQFKQFLPELSNQIASLQKQKTAMDSVAGNVNKTYSARIKDIRDKFAIEDKGRRFDFSQKLSAQDIQLQRANIAKLTGEAESSTLQNPEKRSEIQVRVASMNAQASSSEIKNKLAQDNFELDKNLRTENVSPAEAKQLRLKHEQTAKRELSNVGEELGRQLAGIKDLSIARAFEVQTEFMTANIEQMRLESQSLQTRSQASGVNPLARLDLQEQSLMSGNMADIAQAQLEQRNHEFSMDEQLRKPGGKSIEEVAKLRQEYEKTAKVKMGDLTDQLNNQLEALKSQREELLFQQTSKIFESDQQLGQAKSGQLRYQGQGMRAIELDNSLATDKVKFDFESTIRGIDKAVVSGELLVETAARMKSNLTELNEINLRELGQQLDQAKDDFNFENKSQLFNSNATLNSAYATTARNYGMEAPARKLEKEAAISQAGFDLTSKIREIDSMVKSGKLAAETAAQMKTNLEELNNVNLQNINAQFNPLTEAVKSVKGSFQGFLGDVISGNETIGDAFSKMVDSVLQSLSNMAAQLLVEQAFGAIFGLGKGKQAGPAGAVGGGVGGLIAGLFGGGGGGGSGAVGGGVGGLISGIMGFADGGNVVAAPGQGAARHRDDDIGLALRREGPDSVLATLTPGEEVLTRSESLRYRAMGLDRLVKSSTSLAANQVLRFGTNRSSRFAESAAPSTSLIRAQRSERFGRVLGFSAGGIVPGAAVRVPPITNISGGGDTNVTVPITINGDASPGINLPRLQDAMRITAQEEIRKSKRPGGQSY